MHLPVSVRSALAALFLAGLTACTGPVAPGEDEPARAGCEKMLANCDGSSANGCEVDLDDDVENCGRCGVTCEPDSSGRAHCDAGSCRIDCADDVRNCDGDIGNGCETDILDNPRHCGGCGRDCGDAACVDGACACAEQTTQGEQLPLELLFLIDRSGSMVFHMDEASTNKACIDVASCAGDIARQRWPAVRAALAGFLRSPQTVGLGVGLQFFPAFKDKEGKSAPGTSADDQKLMCVADYYNPDQSEYTGLPVEDVAERDGGGDAGPFLDWFDARVSETELPDGPTPSLGALPGMLTYARQRARETAAEGRKVAVVLVTDGAPSRCFDGADSGGLTDEMIQKGVEKVLPLVKEAREAGVDTYVVGVGRDMSGVAPLRMLADAGSTLPAFVVDGTGAIVTKSFTQPAVGESVNVDVSLARGLVREDMGKYYTGMPVWLPESGSAYVVKARVSDGTVALTRVSADGLDAGKTVGHGVGGSGAPASADFEDDGSAKNADAVSARPLLALVATSFKQPAAGSTVKVTLDSRSALAKGALVYIAESDSLYAVDSANPYDRSEMKDASQATVDAATLRRLGSGGMDAGTSVPAGATVQDASINVDVLLPVATSLNSSLSCPDLATVTVTQEQATASECADGGIAIVRKSERSTWRREVLCKGKSMPSVSISDEPAGAHCAFGGRKLVVTDGAGDESTRYVCFGWVGKAISDAPLQAGTIAVVDERSGGNCDDGGKKITLATGGVQQVVYACGADAKVSASSVEPPGAHCADGGLKVEVEADGASATYYACDAFGAVTATLKTVDAINAGDLLYLDSWQATVEVLAVDAVSLKALLRIVDFMTAPEKDSQGGLVAPCGWTSADTGDRFYAGSPRRKPSVASGAQALLQALSTIRGNLIGCEFQPPAGDGKEEIDYDKVNIDMVVDGQSEALGRTDAEGDCGEAGGWYFEYGDGADADPTSIHLCPATCKKVKSGMSTEMKVQLGCESRAAVSRG